MALQIGTDDLGKMEDPPAKGNYHVAITVVDEEGGNSGEMIVDMEILAGTTPQQEGRIWRAYYPPTIAFAKFFHRLAISTGLTTMEEVKKAELEKRGITYEFTKMVGRQLMITLHDEEYNGETRTKMAPFHVWSVIDPKCASWPKNEKMLKKGGYEIAKAESKTTAKHETIPANESLLDDINI